MRLHDRVAIIAGAGTVKPGMGNGRATALLFAREGASIVAVDKFLESAEETVRLIRELGGKAIAIQADVTKEEQAKNAVEQAVVKYGRLDILFNNVGIAYGTRAGIKVPENEWDDIMATNLKGILFMSKYAIPEMAKSGGGAIVTSTWRRSSRTSTASRTPPRSRTCASVCATVRSGSSSTAAGSGRSTPARAETTRATA